MRTILTSATLTIALFILASGAHAQSRTDLARQYVELPAVQNMMDDMFSRDAIYAQFKAGFPKHIKISNAKKRRIGGILTQGMAHLRPALTKIMISEAARTFTKAELVAMVDFYSSKIGASILSKSSRLTTRSMVRLSPHMQAIRKSMAPAIYKIIKD